MTEQRTDRYVAELEEERRRLQGRVRLLEGLFRDTMIVNRALAERLEQTVGKGAAAEAQAEAGAAGTKKSVGGTSPQPPRGREETEALTERIQELLRIRENLLENVRASIGGLTAELERAESRPFLPGTPPQPAPTAPPPPSAEATTAVTIRPIADLPTMVEIERSLQALPGVLSVFIRSFERGTAVIEVAGPPAAQLRELLHDAFPFPFDDQSGTGAGIALLLDPGEGGAPL